VKLEELALASTTLPNGLRVVTARLRAGPAIETEPDSGLSHFLEHMLYRGTKALPSAHDQADAFETLGGSLSATTYVDHGSMAVAVPPRSLAEVLPLFAEVYQRPIFSGIDIEKAIIREEQLEGVDEDGRRIDADELIREQCFADHALGRPIVGTRERLDGFDRAALERHHAGLYVGANTVLCVAGPVDPDMVLKQVEGAFGELPRGEAPGFDALPEQSESRFQYVANAGSQTELRVAFRAPAELGDLEPAAELLLRVIDDGMSTRLYHRICDELGLCYDVSAGYESYASGGIFDVAAEMTHERAAQVLTEILTMVRDLSEHGPTDAELAKAKTRLEWHFDTMLDEPADMAAFVASGVLTGVALTPAVRRDQLLAVTRDEVRRAAAWMFRPEGSSVVVVGELKKRDRKALRELAQTWR
jgi:predicted Zn-dependent peptidase